MTPNISNARIGIAAIKPIIPKAIDPGFAATTNEAPDTKGNRKVEDIGPVATPPLSKAIPAKRGGTNGNNKRIRAYIGIMKKRICMILK